MYGENITFSYAELENLFSPYAMTEQDHITIEPNQNQEEIPEKPEIPEIPFPEEPSEREDDYCIPEVTPPAESSCLHNYHETGIYLNQ